MNSHSAFFQPRYSNSRALIIGINEYKNASPLSYAVSDAEEIRDIITNELNFPLTNVTCLINGDATRDAILQSYLNFTNSDIEPNERIFVFFAGHGHTRTGIRGEIGYLVPHDADMSDFSTFIRWDELTRNAELIPAKHILFIMDACYGGLAVTRNLRPGSSRFLKDMTQRYSRQVLTAGKADEAVADSGGPLPNHSVFTGHLIMGLRGEAAIENGVITANTLMSYVYRKVANDRNSNQTPHYGYLDGDGDFILRASLLDAVKEDGTRDIDNLITIPFPEEEPSRSTTQSKISTAKKLLSEDSATIELFDFVIGEIRHFLAASSQDSLDVQTSFSKDELLRRISDYENIAIDLSVLMACISYWSKPSHKQILQKAIARSVDYSGLPKGIVIWFHLKWYPAVIEMYMSGIAAVEGQRYDSLMNIFYTKVKGVELPAKIEYFVKFVADTILNFNRDNTFKQIPGHENYFTPLSEYLFKLLQPTLDDMLFLGESYESSFDEFEILFALVIADVWEQQEGHLWFPIGRFGWKENRGTSGPLSGLITTALAEGEEWGPIKQGLFGGDINRFTKIAKEVQARIANLNWW